MRAGKHGEPVTDGPFPETKEYLARYRIVDVDTSQRAYEIAAKASAAVGTRVRRRGWNPSPGWSTLRSW